MLQQASNEILNWSIKWGLEVNFTKTKVMPFGTTGKINIILNGKEIENVSEYKDLGVMLDTNLIFEKQDTR